MSKYNKCLAIAKPPRVFMLTETLQHCVKTLEKYL